MHKLAVAKLSSVALSRDKRHLRKFSQVHCQSMQSSAAAPNITCNSALKEHQDALYVGLCKILLSSLSKVTLEKTRVRDSQLLRVVRVISRLM